MTIKIPSNKKCELCGKMKGDIRKHKEIDICAVCRSRTLRYFIRKGFQITLSKPKFPEHMEHRCNDKDCKFCKEFSF